MQTQNISTFKHKQPAQGFKIIKNSNAQKRPVANLFSSLGVLLLYSSFFSIISPFRFPPSLPAVLSYSPESSMGVVVNDLIIKDEHVYLHTHKIHSWLIPGIEWQNKLVSHFKWVANDMWASLAAKQLRPECEKRKIWSVLGVSQSWMGCSW